MPPASSSGRKAPLAAVFGCAGPRLTEDERALFRDADPFGLILFRRNCETPAQVRALTDSFRELVGRGDAPVLVDEEGGRVQRLRPPVWPSLPPMRRIGELAERDPDAGAEAALLAGRLLAEKLRPLGVDVDCAPVADVLLPETTDAIGDRAFAADPDLVATLCRALAAGLLRGGVLPVVKHLPGHGRAVVDSHLETPRVTAPLADLQTVDFMPFHALQALPVAMVAHVVYTALDPVSPASVSPKIIANIIRGEFRFDGFLFSDDIVMEALGGTQAQRAKAVLAAGCDAVLHCNGDFVQMAAIAAEIPPLTPEAVLRWERARTYPVAEPDAFDTAEGHARLDFLLAGATV
ncbi:MAG TPA: beta-N-acetylhexosaminidase [Azospirillaceae bacterium]|nr:beta-N-acetylhexosaminidase [Azospirillaceae bacterium]